MDYISLCVVLTLALAAVPAVGLNDACKSFTSCKMGAGTQKDDELYCSKIDEYIECLDKYLKDCDHEAIVKKFEASKKTVEKTREEKCLAQPVQDGSGGNFGNLAAVYSSLTLSFGLLAAFMGVHPSFL